MTRITFQSVPALFANALFKIINVIVIVINLKRAAKQWAMGARPQYLLVRFFQLRKTSSFGVFRVRVRKKLKDLKNEYIYI